MKKGLARVDFLGNTIFMAAMIALLFGLVWVSFNIPGIPGGLYCPLSWVFLDGQCSGMNRVFIQGERSRGVRPEAYYIATRSRERGITKH
jgi:hypothetical protein